MEAGLTKGGAEAPRWRRYGAWFGKHPVRTVVGCWLFQVGWLLMLGIAGGRYGLDVWPMGEDRNWIRFMFDAPGTEMMRQFWRTNDRNPLSPWWYWLFRWPIFNLDWGLYALRRLVDLLLAASLAALLHTLIRDRGKPWGLAGGLLVLACSFNGFREQIVWNFNVATAIGLLALWAYVRFVDEAGRRGPLLGIALVAYLVSIATYTLNAGFLVAIAIVAAFRRENAGEVRRARRERMLDVGCFVAITAVFLLAWYTTTRPTSTYYGMSLALITRQFASSVAQSLWHPDYTWYLANAWREPSVLLASLVPMAVFAGVALLALLAKPASAPRAVNAVWLIVVGAGILCSVIALESTSAVWLPGFRSKMFYQVTAPLLLLVVITLVAALLTRGVSAKVANAFSVTAVIAAIVATFPASMLYNRILVDKSTAQKALMSALAEMADAQPDARTFVIRHAGDSTAIWGADALSDNYIKTMLRRPYLSMRFLQRQPAPQADWASWWRIDLGSDAEGVRNAAWPNTGTQSYRNVRFVEWDGTKLVMPRVIGPAWFEGWQADWKRSAPITQSAGEAATCPSRFDFDVPAMGRGWSVPERRAPDGYAMWMADRAATLTLPTACSGQAKIEILVATYMADDIYSGLRLRVRGEDVPLRRGLTEGREHRLTGEFRAAPEGGNVTLEFSVPRTVVPSGGARTLAVMFRRVTLAPI